MEILFEIEKLAKKGIKKILFWQKVGIIGNFLFCPVFLISLLTSFAKNSIPERGIKVFLIITGFCTLIWLGSILETLIRCKKWNRILKSLKTMSNEIVWIYQAIKKTNIVPFYFIYFHLIDGKKEFIHLKKEEAEQFIMFMEKVYSDISIGYSVELEKLFKKEPMTLKHNPVRIDGIKTLS